MWDNPGTNPIELLQYNSLSAKESSAAFTLGYTTPLTWDCWQNHYTSYNWTYLGATYIQVVQWYEILGWNAIKWDDKLVDPPDGMTWYELRDNERYAAAQLCYTQRTWDSNIIDGIGYGGFPGIRKPNFRYTDWYTVDENARAVAANSLGYTPLTWNALVYIMTLNHRRGIICNRMKLRKLYPLLVIQSQHGIALSIISVDIAGMTYHSTDLTYL